jgi:hypothetical protein
MPDGGCYEPTPPAQAEDKLIRMVEQIMIDVSRCVTALERK